MNLFKSLKLQFRPPKIDDPEFGQLTFMYISNHPERSYWEAETRFAGAVESYTSLKKEHGAAVRSREA